jgi:hypothetical protein
MLNVREYLRPMRAPLTDQMLQPRRVHRILRERVLCVDDRKRSVLLEWSGVVAQLVQKNTESPDVCSQ